MPPIVQDSPSVSWIDEELRKEKARSSELQDTLDKQQVALVDQAQRIMMLEDRLAKFAADLTRIPDVEQSLQHTRDELVIMISELRQEQQKRESTFLRNRQIEREQDNRSVQEITMELQRIDPLEQSIAVRQAEERRINEAVLRLQEEFGTYGKHLLRAEESRRQLADSIAKGVVEIGEARSLIEDLDDIQQTQFARLPVIEEDLQRALQQVAELQSIRQELTDQQDELLESQRRADRVRAQSMTEWGRKLDGFSHQLDTWAERMLFYNDQNEKGRRVLREVQELAQEVSQQQDRLRQLQRVSEEQIRRELRELHSEMDRRWAQETERHTRDATALGEKDDAQDDRLAVLEQAHHDFVARLDAFLERLNAMRSELVQDADKTKHAEQQAWLSFSRALQSVAAEVANSLEPREE